MTEHGYHVAVLNWFLFSNCIFLSTLCFIHSYTVLYGEICVSQYACLYISGHGRWKSWKDFPCPSKGIKQGGCQLLSEGGTSTWLELLLLTQDTNFLKGVGSARIKGWTSPISGQFTDRIRTQRIKLCIIWDL